MHLYIKQKLFTIPDEFDILDENGEWKYRVEGEVFTFAKKLHITDRKYKEVGFVEQKLFKWRPTFNVYANGELIGQIEKRLELFKHRYEVYGKDWTVEGDFLSHDYCIMEGTKIIASIHKKWMSWGDSYELDLLDGQDEIALIAVILAIDTVMTSNGNNHNY